MTSATAAATPYPGSLRFPIPIPAVVALTALLFLTALRPVGYHGGGWDDWHYLQAARCAAENGLCVPTSHWWTRWPVVAPMGAALWLFGESRSVLWTVPAIYAAAATILLAIIVERQFGRSAALVAALALVATPVFNERVLGPNADTAELTGVLAAVAAVQWAVRRHSRRWAVAAGMLLALAVVARPTAVTLLPLFVGGLALSPVHARRLILPFVAGALGMMCAETMGYWLWTGDAFTGWRLALSHTAIPSSELAASVDIRQSPLFNIAYIDGWAPAAGIELHWTVDGVINLLAHDAIGPTLVFAMIVLILAQRFLGLADRRSCVLLIGAAVLHGGALVYALAVDPKPRMFLFEVAIAAAIIGVCAGALQRRQFTLLLPVGLALLFVKSVIAQVSTPPLSQLEPVAASWIAQGRQPIATNEFSRRVLALVPSVNRLPTHRAGAADQAVLLVMAGPCSAERASLGRGSWSIQRQFAGGEPGAPALCLFVPTFKPDTASVS